GTGPSPATSPSVEKRGEVIPFPTERSSYTLPEIDDEMEREIMSKLDEILPDTPSFNEKGFGASSASSEADSRVVDFDMSAADAAVEEMDARIEAEPEIETESPPPDESEERKPARSTSSKKPPLAMDAEDVMKLTRPKKRPRQEEAPTGPTFKISRPILITII